MKASRFIAALCAGLLAASLAAPVFAGPRMGGGRAQKQTGSPTGIQQRARDGSCLEKDKTRERNRLQEQDQVQDRDQLQQRDRIRLKDGNPQE